jgi:hypothetical protein
MTAMLLGAARLLLIAHLAAPGLPVEPVKVAGKWNVTLELPSITGHPVLVLKQEGEKLTGTYEGRYGQSSLSGTVKEKTLSFTVTLVAEGTQTQGVFEGAVDGDTMGGSVSFEGAGDGTWSAVRAK